MLTPLGTPTRRDDPEVIESIGSGTNGTKIFSSADTSSDDPESALFRAIMTKCSPESPTEGYAVTGYQGTLGFVRATQSLTGTDITPATISTAITSTTDAVLPAADGLMYIATANPYRDSSPSAQWPGRPHDGRGQQANPTTVGIG
ncbi:MAG: hypothetical protein C0482_21275 [Gordonia sp.]|nr:hypothetical protein [Gordonia sp. (in: high G+C Gram-positive bacteria)]